MKYSKPELTLLAPAAEAIQGMSKTSAFHDSLQVPTASAYEADE